MLSGAFRRTAVVTVTEQFPFRVLKNKQTNKQSQSMLNSAMNIVSTLFLQE